MPASDRTQIHAHLQTLEQKLRATRASDEEIALRKSDYFRNYQTKHKTEDKIVHLPGRIDFHRESLWYHEPAFRLLPSSY